MLLSSWETHSNNKTTSPRAFVIFGPIVTSRPADSRDWTVESKCDERGKFCGASISRLRPQRQPEGCCRSLLPMRFCSVWWWYPNVAQNRLEWRKEACQAPKGKRVKKILRRSRRSRRAKRDAEQPRMGLQKEELPCKLTLLSKRCDALIHCYNSFAKPLDR